MSVSLPLQDVLLERAETLLNSCTSSLSASEQFEARLQVLEASASLIGGFSYPEYQSVFAINSLFTSTAALGHAARLLEELGRTPIPAPLALSALAREPLPLRRQREAGAYHTDFRLAQLLAVSGSKLIDDKSPVIDPASGSGMLLTALALATCGSDKQRAAGWLASRVHAADSSSSALRGACLSLSALTSDLGAICAMKAKWFNGDSLTRPLQEWSATAHDGFGLVIANPPWEKVKLSRHEYSQGLGRQRHYGQEYHSDDLNGFAEERARTQAYARAIGIRYPLATNGEVDLFVAFTDLFLRLVAEGGGVAALVPAGLIRSMGTRSLRAALLQRSAALELTVIDNHARFFAIDTRFKFLSIVAKSKTRSQSDNSCCLSLAHAQGTRTECVVVDVAHIDTDTLSMVRPDLTIPEVRSDRDWDLFVRCSRSGIQWSHDDSEWQADFCREVDMTRQRDRFHLYPGAELLPIVEGRMVHQHRFGAKSYVSGTGRRALWVARSLGQSSIVPQFWMPVEELPARVASRVKVQRAGFCDIAGQTNERSMMAALVPPGVVCGNKVPTAIFEDQSGHDRLALWVGMVNSLPFDWLLRRVLTTTVNYFLLRSVPLPPIAVDSDVGIEMSRAVRELHHLDSGGGDTTSFWRMAQLRREIDLKCHIAYGAELQDLQLMLEDFPLLDRGQPPLPGEARSTVTRDYLLAGASEVFGVNGSRWSKRVDVARALGAVPYVPSQVEMTSDESSNV